MRKRTFLAAFLIVFTVMLSSFAFYFYQILYTPNVQVRAIEDRILHIDKGMTFKELQERLYEENYVQDLVSFSFLAKLMGYHKAVKPGHYTLRPDMTNLELIRYLKIGNPIVRVTFNSFKTIDQLPAFFEKHLEFDSAELAQYFALGSTQEKYGFNKANLIGLFLPNTYEFYYRTSPEELCDKMLGEYEKFWTEERIQKAKNLGLTPQQVTTLASIVNAETSKLDEAPRIAGVYLNRLRIGMRLQADPTLIFAQQDFDIRRVRHGDRDIDSPYNTYKYAGLPPGPINMPPTAYIDAVLKAESHKYLYFCAREDFSGYHAFASNFDEHLKNAAKFQRALNQRQILR
jgi:UPF0755 protein